MPTRPCVYHPSEAYGLGRTCVRHSSRSLGRSLRWVLYQTRIILSNDAVSIRWTPLRLLEDAANVLIPAAVVGIALVGGALAVPGALPLLVIPAAAAAAASGWLYRGREWIRVSRATPAGHHTGEPRVYHPADISAIELCAGANRIRALGYRHTDSQADAAHILLHIVGQQRPDWVYARPRRQQVAVATLASRLAEWLDIPLSGAEQPPPSP